MRGLLRYVGEVFGGVLVVALTWGALAVLWSFL